MKNTKSYIFVLIAILYFAVFFATKNGFILQGFALKIKGLFVNNDFEYYIGILNSIVGIFLYYYIFSIIERKIDSILKKSSNKFSFKYHNLIANVFNRFTDVLRYITTIYVGINLIVIPEKYSFIITNLLNFAFLTSFLVLLTTFVNQVFISMIKNQKNDETAKHIFPILNKFVVIFIWVIGIILLLSNLGYNVSALITGAGVGGVAIALASQKSVANIFGALNIIFNRPFKIGDKIKIGTFVGTVSDIGLIYLKLESEDKTQILIPNETIITATIENLSYKKD